MNLLMCMTAAFMVGVVVGLEIQLEATKRVRLSQEELRKEHEEIRGRCALLERDHAVTVESREVVQ